MARDWIMLTCVQPVQPVFRAFDYDRETATFGYFQRLDEARTHLVGEVAEPKAFQLQRRPTAGGLVVHRHHWTYSLVVPSHDPVGRLPANQFYRELHEGIAEAMQPLGLDIGLLDQNEKEPTPAPGGSCATQPVPGDLLQANTQKFAGAALRRTPKGLLAQGNLWFSSALPAPHAEIAQRVAGALAKRWGWDPPIASDPPMLTPACHATLDETAALWASDDWNARR